VVLEYTTAEGISRTRPAARRRFFRGICSSGNIVSSRLVRVAAARRVAGGRRWRDGLESACGSQKRMAVVW